MSAEIMLQPGQEIRPTVSEKDAIDLVSRLYGLKVLTIRELDSYDDRNFHVTVSANHSNPNIDIIHPHGYVLKVLNSLDSPKQHVDAEHNALQILHNNDIICPLPVPNLKNSDKSREKLNDGKKETSHIVRLLTFIPGKILASSKVTPHLLTRAGCFLAQVDKALQGFSHEALTHHATVWNLKELPRLKEFLCAIKDKKRLEMITEIIDTFNKDVLPNLHKFKKGIIHGDFNEQNVLIRETNHENGESEVAGLLDFGDMSDSYYVFEVAIAIMYLTVGGNEVAPLDTGGYVLAGYTSQMTLSDAELDVLPLCVAARYCQSLVMGAYSYLQDPGNEYLLVTEKRGWPQLEEIWKTPKTELLGKWKTAMNKRISKNEV